MELPFDPHLVLNDVILTLLVLVTFAIVAIRDLLASTILFGIFSLLMALQYLVLEAPDVAITEAAVGAGISTIIFLAAIVHTGRGNRGPKRHSRYLPAVVVSIIGLTLIYATAEMPHFGSPDAPANLHVAPYYISQTSPEVGIPNIVTAVLASYRGFDTMGEVFVVFTALIAVTLLLGANRPNRGGKHDA